MFRKFTVFICLLSFCPAAFGAQDLTGVTNLPLLSGQQSQQRSLNLTPPERSYSPDKVIVSENLKNGDIAKAEEPKKGKASGLTFSEWAEIHFGDNRWVWWVGGAAVLVALHAFVFVDGK